MKTEQIYYDVISPDGVSISAYDIYATKRVALKAFIAWRSRFKNQGYYSSNKGRIHLDELKYFCKIQEIKKEQYEH